jgi:selenium-binding protein 1
MMDIRMIPGDQYGRAYSAGMFDGGLYLIDPRAARAARVFDFAEAVPHEALPLGPMPQILQMTRDGSRLFTGLFQAGRVVMLDTTNRSNPRLIAGQRLGLGAGPHNLMLTHDEQRLVVSDYFLVQDLYPLASPGKVQLEGDHRIHVFKVRRNDVKRDPRFNLDFDTAFPSGPARPHGIAFK